MDTVGTGGVGDTYGDPDEPVDLSVHDTTVPDGVDPAMLAAYCLMLGDDALVFSYRLQGWMSRAPGLEEEAALGTIALDLLGQARVLLARAGFVDGSGRTPDALAFTRTAEQFRNVRLVESDDDDFAGLAARLLVFATWRLALFDGLCRSTDPALAALAGGAVKDSTFHRDHAMQWVLRLGTGTELSRDRMRAGLRTVWPDVDELFRPHPVETALRGVAVDVTALRTEFDTVLSTVLDAAALQRPSTDGGTGHGRDGVHSAALDGVLARLHGLAEAADGAD